MWQKTLLKSGSSSQSLSDLQFFLLSYSGIGSEKVPILPESPLSPPISNIFQHKVLMPKCCIPSTVYFDVLAKFTHRMSIQSVCTQQYEYTWSVWRVNSCTIIVCCDAFYWQVLFCISAYAFNFISCRFGSLFWLPRVSIGSLFHKK